MFYAQFYVQSENGTLDLAISKTGNVRDVRGFVAATHREMVTPVPGFPETGEFELVQDDDGTVVFAKRGGGEKLVVMHNLHTAEQNRITNYVPIPTHQPKGPLQNVPVGRNLYKGSAATKGEHVHGRFAGGRR